MIRSKHEESTFEHHAFIVAASFHILRRDQPIVIAEKFNAQFFPDNSNLARSRDQVKWFRNCDLPLVRAISERDCTKEFDNRWSEFEAELRKRKVKENWKDALKGGGERATEKLQPGIKKEDEVEKAEEEGEEAREERDGT
ncbi:MAG: hypothetical protein LQ342_005110 [Letrouitia transgressa]|nr:MAG: hypothetical protein LQ342_005110 [Letrouitia transgressa]